MSEIDISYTNLGSRAGLVRHHQRNNATRQCADIARVIKTYLQSFAEEKERAIVAHTATDVATIGTALRQRPEFDGLATQTHMSLVSFDGAVLLKVTYPWGIGLFLNYVSWRLFVMDIKNIGAIELPQSSLYYHNLGNRELGRAAQRTDHTIYFRFEASFASRGEDGRLNHGASTYQIRELNWQQVNNNDIDDLRSYGGDNSYSTNHSAPNAEHKAARPELEITVYNGTRPNDHCRTYTTVEGPRGCLGTGTYLLRGAKGGVDGTVAFVSVLKKSLVQRFYANKRSFIGRQPSEEDVWNDSLGNSKLVVVRFNRAFTLDDFKR